MADIIAYFAANGAEYLRLLAEHVEVSVLSLALAALIAIPLGVVSARSRWAERLSVGVASIVRIIPSLAVLVVLVPILGVGVVPAVVALALLAIPPILINTAVAFSTLPAEVLEAARGMGMTEGQLFRTIKVPLAFPVAFAGVRTAAAEVVASATLAAYIGAGGLGELIFTGMGLMRTDLLWIGGVSVALLSLAVGWLLGWIDHRVRRYEHV